MKFNFLKKFIVTTLFPIFCKYTVIEVSDVRVIEVDDTWISVDIKGDKLNTGKYYSLTAHILIPFKDE